MAPKVRLVKCPKCRQVLQESVDIPIYRCGGCDLILQAKHRKITPPDHHLLPPQESNYASADNHSAGFTPHLHLPSSPQNPLPRDQNISVNSEHSSPADRVQLAQNIHTHSEDNAEISNGIRSSTKLQSRENGGSSPIDEGNLELEANGTSSPVPHENSAEETEGIDLQDNEVLTSVKNLGVQRVEKPAEEITLTNAPLSTRARDERFKRTSPRAYDRRMSMETTASTEYVDPVSDFSGTLGETTQSPAGNFPWYHHGELPSYGAPETHHLNRSAKEANSALTRERLCQEKYRMKYNSEIRYPEKNSEAPVSSSHEGGFIRAGGRLGDRMVEPPVRGSEGRYWRRPDRGELPPRIPRKHWQQRNYYDYGGPSKQVPAYSGFSSGIRSSDVPAHPEQEKMKLLRMVHELEDQLKRTCDLQGISKDRRTPGSHSMEKPGDFYYSRDQMVENYLRMGLPTYSRMDERDKRWRHHSRYPKRPFSAEMAETSHQPNDYRYHPVGWRRSEPLPPPAAAHNRKFYDIRNSRSIYSPYSSCPSSSQHYMDYGFSPCGYDTRSDDEVYDTEKEYDEYRERKQMANWRVMTAAGGAPWIICSHCTRLVQLPTDFLLLKKKCHRLRCGSCSTVLKFSLQNRRQLVPFVRHSEVPPPSEADDRGGSLRENTPPCLNGLVEDEMVSYSEDIGMSYSTEADPGSLGMLQSVGDRMDKSLVEEEEGQQKSGSSPLHRLMGYSSVSQVFRGPDHPNS